MFAQYLQYLHWISTQVPVDVISHFLAPAPGPAQLTVSHSTGNMQESLIS